MSARASRFASVESGGGDRLERRVCEAAEAALADDRYVTAIDVLVGLGWLQPRHVDEWRQGRVDCLERVTQANLQRLSKAMSIFHRWARSRGLKPSEASYVARSRDRRPLRFSTSGDPETERAYRTHWVSPELSQRQRDRLAERQSRPPDLVVVSPLKDWTCAGCGGSGDFLLMEDPGPLCMTCADMDHLVFLAAGDAALTRRARRASGLSAVVVRFSRARRRYERQGILVEEHALGRAEQECLADEQARARRRERDSAHRAEDGRGDRPPVPALPAATRAGHRAPRRRAREWPGRPQRGRARARSGRAGARRRRVRAPRGHPLRRAADVGA